MGMRASEITILFRIARWKAGWQRNPLAFVESDIPSLLFALVITGRIKQTESCKQNKWKFHIQ